MVETLRIANYIQSLCLSTINLINQRNVSRDMIPLLNYQNSHTHS